MLGGAGDISGGFSGSSAVPVPVPVPVPELATIIDDLSGYYPVQQKQLKTGA